MGYVDVLLRARKFRMLRSVSRQAMLLSGLDVPHGVEIGKRLHLAHRGFGTVLHSRVVIGDDVTIYHGVTVGRSGFGGGKTIIGNRAVIAAGSVILSGEADRIIGEGAVIGANAVVTQDVPAWEIWAGVPAKRIGVRDGSVASPW